MKKRLSSLFAVLFILGDLCFLNLAIFFSYQLSSIAIEGQELANAVYFFIFSNLAWFFLLLITNPYTISSSTKFIVLLKSLFSFLFVHLLVLISLVFFFGKTYSAQQISLVYAIFIPAILLWKALYFYIVKVLIRKTMVDINFIIVGTGEQASTIRRQFRNHAEYSFKFLGYFDEGGRINNAMAFSGIEEFCLEMNVNEIYCCWPETTTAALKKLIDFGLNSFIRVKVITDHAEFAQKGIQLERFGQIPVLNVAAIPLDDSVNKLMKRFFDICFTLVVVLTVLIWLLPLIALLIKLDSSGPVLFRQRRAGKNNKPFDCLKFRTMYLERKSDFIQATKDDPRITRIGKFLRKTSLDEFPQFVNVIRGEMSIVGPRPHPIQLNDAFADKIRKLMSRHYVKPGITGLAQCMGYRGETKNLGEMKNRLTLDRF
ncbi:undecaprenyl-phosphate glucose phosphotransferase [soil metagenome]